MFTELGTYKDDPKFGDITKKENKMILCSPHKNAFEYKTTAKYFTDDKSKTASDLK